MPNPYGALLRTPGGPQFSAAAFVARLPISMLGIGIVLLVAGAGRSYTDAGAVAAAFAVAEALGQPWSARLVDRHGQRAVVAPLAAGHALALVGLLLLARVGAPVVALAGAAAVAGAALPNVGSLVRARWTYRLSGSTALRTAFSLESVIDEVIFVVGPPLVTLLAVRAGPAAAVLVTLGFLLLGLGLLLPQRGSEPPPGGSDADHGPSALRTPALRFVLVVMVCLGLVFGSLEVVTVAGADAAGNAALAGVLLALYAGGSLVAGLVYGSVDIAAPLRKQLLILALLLPVSLALLPLAASAAKAGALLFLAGFVVSPTLIAAFFLVQQDVPGNRLTEGLTWATTGIGLGVAAGAALGGRAVDLAGAPRAYLVTLASALLTATVVGGVATWSQWRQAGAARSAAP